MLTNPPRAGQETRTPTLEGQAPAAPRSDLDVLLAVYARVADARQSVIDALADSMTLRADLRGGDDAPGVPEVLQLLAHRIDATGQVIAPLLAAEAAALQRTGVTP